ncbi:cache domain-containing sensor histidine kinase [Cohnella thailandensis]|uniref:histidine kinase n=1 Tax=Cohnella thailandensis TaxID=557557 RepID=A0A841T2S5_9BACL|nr:sensor histidine kinase [Cohnella thailandensis]MBB6636915.1 sensor histidine kinase [Cohnella thailandensis]MBP1973204.1 sensor histidine kinase YesM [Cohnella thailandensis]
MNGFRLGKWTLQRKMTLLLVLFILLPLLVFGYSFNGSSGRFVAKRTDQETSQVLNLVKQNVDQMLKEYETQLKTIYDNEEVIAELSRIDGLSGSPSGGNSETVNRFLRNFLRGKEDLDSIYLYTSDGQTYFADFKGSNFFLSQFGQHPEWQRTVEAAEGRAVWLPTYELPSNRYLPQATHYFLIGMQVKDVTESMQTLGSIYMNVKISALDRLVKEVNVSPNGILLLADGMGHLLWSRNPEAYGVKLSDIPFYRELLEYMEPFTNQELNGELYRVGYVQSSYNNWLYLSLIPQSDMTAQSRDLRQFLLVTLIAFGGSFLLLAWLTSRYITRPVRQMARAMKQIHKDNMDIQLQTTSADEIGLLQAAYNGMRGRIADLIQEVRIVSGKEKEAEIRALQAQINPHFVYNSLDTINWMAIEREQTDISEMIAALSDIMRYAIRSGGPWVKLEEELKWANDYAYLQKMRFEDRFGITFDTDPSLLSLRVPRLFLQPYLENAILHGMENVEEGGQIAVSISEDKSTGGIRVVIADNGNGIPQEELQQIMLRRSKGIGIYNLDDRLKLEFGAEYGVSIRSSPEEGTVVEIVLPRLS